MIKPIETHYKGRIFRSRLEAQVAVGFDVIGVEWQYEPGGYILEDGTPYLPDFVMTNVKQRYSETVGDIFVEVKGRMTPADLHKIELFSHEYPILVIGPLDHQSTVTDCAGEYYFWNECFLDGDSYPAWFTRDNGALVLCGPDNDQWDLGETMGEWLTAAKQVRFEHGESSEAFAEAQRVKNAMARRARKESERIRKQEQMAIDQIQRTLELKKPWEKYI